MPLEILYWSHGRCSTLQEEAAPKQVKALRTGRLGALLLRDVSHGGQCSWGTAEQTKSLTLVGTDPIGSTALLCLDLTSFKTVAG